MRTKLMKAAFYIGDKTFRLEESQPLRPEVGQVSVNVAYCGICGTDLHAYHGKMDARIGHHRVIGHEMSGVVSKVGVGVDNLSVGEHVVIRPLDHCGDCPACKAGHTHICHNLKFLGLDTDGAFQQTWTVPAHTAHKLPDDLPLQYGALIEPVSVAVHDVKRANVQPGEDVLVIGGGPIGMLVAMVARNAGARVMLSEVSEARLAFAQELGFDAINPMQSNLVDMVNARTGGKGAEVVFEVSGSQAGIDAMTETAATRGRIVMVAIHAAKPQINMFQFFWRELELFGARVYAAEDFDEAIRLVAEGVIHCEKMITDVRDLEQIGEAFEALSGNPQAMKSLIKCG
jgi:(R,R)-butanediol dehydrogenase/meso-butanediol dehydrogenase/diacetyl reductase